MAIAQLPSNYDFQIINTLEKILEIHKENKDPDKLVQVALQFPDGLAHFSILISDIISTFGNCRCYILGDTTYGACCVDDISSYYLGVDLLVHYAHSCLIPSPLLKVKTMYVFVEIAINVDHLVDTIELNFPIKDNIKIYLCGSIQFNSSIFVCRRKLLLKGYSENSICIPQIKPRNQGEIIGCTSPILTKDDKFNDSVVIFVCDGRFHMESLMIQNPSFKFYQYNPFTKRITEEEYDLPRMKKIRNEQISKLKNAQLIGVLFGTLGRQGDPKILKNVCNLLKQKNKRHIVIMMNEISEEQIAKFPQIDCFVQVACPRLSIDWSSEQFSKPMLTPYECFLCFDENTKNEDDSYLMDNYASNCGPWGHYYKEK